MQQTNEMKKLKEITEKLHEVVYQLPYNDFWHLVLHAYVDLATYIRLQEEEAKK